MDDNAQIVDDYAEVLAEYGLESRQVRDFEAQYRDNAELASCFTEIQGLAARAADGRQRQQYHTQNRVITLVVLSGLAVGLGLLKCQPEQESKAFPNEIATLAYEGKNSLEIRCD